MKRSLIKSHHHQCCQRVTLTPPGHVGAALTQSDALHHGPLRVRQVPVHLIDDLLLHLGGWGTGTGDGVVFSCIILHHKHTAVNDYLIVSLLLHRFVIMS